MNTLRTYMLLLALGTLTPGFSQSVLGTWKTIDDATGDAKAYVELYQENGKLYGKITKLLEEGREDAICIKCKGALKDKPVVGIKVIDGFEPTSDGEYKGSKLLDPEQGKTYKGKVWLDPDNPNQLKVRGYIAFLYRTQTWHRTE